MPAIAATMVTAASDVVSWLTILPTNMSPCDAAVAAADAAPTPAEPSSLQQFSNWYESVHGYLSVFVCMFGIISNTMNIVVLTQREMLTSTNVILTSLAVADIISQLKLDVPSVCAGCESADGRWVPPPPCGRIVPPDPIVGHRSAGRVDAGSPRGVVAGSGRPRAQGRPCHDRCGEDQDDDPDGRGEGYSEQHLRETVDGPGDSLHRLVVVDTRPPNDLNIVSPTNSS